MIFWCIEYSLIEVQSRIFDLGACVATPINNEQSSLSKLVYTHVRKTMYVL